jgi:lipopolysaccharide transport system ATP-binding protein
MSELAIRVDNLSKRYRIGQGARAPYKTLRESLMGMFAAPLNWFRSDPQSPDGKNHIWALKDVSFAVNHGEVLGIIGRNGAGKSTLLKVLSRITEPTTGSVDLYGRVGSLLEVGTGFHPELTGRENILLNGAILGMRRAEIERKFDEIVAFAEIEKFIDTPVKFYSSGMYVRLAFAVAAHLEPEILLVDEVLAVGDAAFQKKCLGKMGDVARQGRTVLFVSHNMQAIETLCSRCLLLSKGRIDADGGARDVVAQYYFSISSGNEHLQNQGCLNVDRDVLLENNTAEFTIKTIKVVTDSGDDAPFARTNEPLVLQIEYCAKEIFYNVAFIVHIYTRSGTELIRLSTNPISGYPIRELYGQGVVELTIKSLPLTADTYIIDVMFVYPFRQSIAEYKSVGLLTVSTDRVYNGEVLMDSSRGYIVVQHEWRIS